MQSESIKDLVNKTKINAWFHLKIHRRVYQQTPLILLQP